MQKSIYWALLSLCLSSTSSASPNPWSLDNTLETPQWLSVSGQSRIRHEHLDEQFRAGGKGNDQILVFRTNLLAVVTWNQWQFGVEILDSRQAYGDDSTKISSGDVNPLDILQMYSQWKMNNLFASQSESRIKVGRFTMDVGSRRFVARNRYRNTINSFTGIDWQWVDSNDQQLRAFYTLPVQRLPREFDRRKRNRTQGDDQDTEVSFWGVYYKLPKHMFSNLDSRAELFYFGLDENDAKNRPTRNRDIHTIGGRIYKKKLLNHFDYQLEGAYQFGQSRASSDVSDTRDLDHTAYFARAEIGYSLDHSWWPRLAMQLDYASGDDDPDDGDNNRFDSLFGVRRFDFGPLGIYGPFARANIISPGIRLQLKPSNNTSMFIAHRGYWLASDRDAWTVAQVRDPEGNSGSYIAQQTEVRFRWNIIPENVRWELGAAYMFKGEFADNAPNANDQGDSKFFYNQLLFSF